jgi:hypothetical protein
MKGYAAPLYAAKIFRDSAHEFTIVEATRKQPMKVLHLLDTLNRGGVQTLVLDVPQRAREQSGFNFCGNRRRRSGRRLSLVRRRIHTLAAATRSISSSLRAFAKLSKNRTFKLSMRIRQSKPCTLTLPQLEQMLSLS